MDLIFFAILFIKTSEEAGNEIKTMGTDSENPEVSKQTEKLFVYFQDIEDAMKELKENLSSSEEKEKIIKLFQDLMEKMIEMLQEISTSESKDEETLIQITKNYEEQTGELFKEINESCCKSREEKENCGCCKACEKVIKKLTSFTNNLCESSEILQKADEESLNNIFSKIIDGFKAFISELGETDENKEAEDGTNDNDQEQESNDEQNPESADEEKTTEE